MLDPAAPERENELVTSSGLPDRPEGHSALTQMPPQAPDPDIHLVRRARGGDFDAFQDLVSRYERQVYTLALRILRQREDAEDVVQDTFLSVMEHLPDFREEATFHTWLVRIATNHALNVLRKRKGTLPVSSREDAGEKGLPHPEFIAPWRDGPEAIAELKETRELLTKALEALEDKHLVVFLLRDVEGLSTEETARALGISDANARIRLFRARLTLREELTRAFGDERNRVVPSHSHG